jgi:hypothetical protein
LIDTPRLRLEFLLVRCAFSCAKAPYSFVVAPFLVRWRWLGVELLSA